MTEGNIIPDMEVLVLEGPELVLYLGQHGTKVKKTRVHEIFVRYKKQIVIALVSVKGTQRGYACFTYGQLEKVMSFQSADIQVDYYGLRMFKYVAHKDYLMKAR